MGFCSAHLRALAPSPPRPPPHTHCSWVPQHIWKLSLKKPQHCLPKGQSKQKSVCVPIAPRQPHALGCLSFSWPSENVKGHSLGVAFIDSVTSWTHRSWLCSTCTSPGQAALSAQSTPLSHPPSCRWFLLQCNPSEGERHPQASLPS